MSQRDILPFHGVGYAIRRGRRRQREAASCTKLAKSEDNERRGYKEHDDTSNNRAHGGQGVFTEGVSSDKSPKRRLKIKGTLNDRGSRRK